MKTATFNIGLSLTIITGNYVYMSKLSNLVQEAGKFSSITIKGITKSSKLKKYIDILVGNGYSLVSENWLRENEIATGATDFSITFSK